MALLSQHFDTQHTHTKVTLGVNGSVSSGRVAKHSRPARPFALHGFPWLAEPNITTLGARTRRPAERSAAGRRWLACHRPLTGDRRSPARGLKNRKFNTVTIDGVGARAT